MINYEKKGIESERMFTQGSGNFVASAVQPKLAIDQNSNNSSLSSSPKSVLPEKVPVDQVSSWSFNPEVHVTVQQTDMEDTSLHELLPQNFSLTMPPNAQHLMEDSVAHSPNNSDYEGQQVSKYLSVSLSHTHTHIFVSIFWFLFHLEYQHQDLWLHLLLDRNHPILQRKLQEPT